MESRNFLRWHPISPRLMWLYHEVSIHQSRFVMEARSPRFYKPLIEDLQWYFWRCCVSKQRNLLFCKIVRVVSHILHHMNTFQFFSVTNFDEISKDVLFQLVSLLFNWKDREPNGSSFGTVDFMQVLLGFIHVAESWSDFSWFFSWFSFDGFDRDHMYVLDLQCYLWAPLS